MMSRSDDLNKAYFSSNLDDYNKNILEIDTYKNTKIEIDQEILNIDKMLDLGNGGVFDYSTDLVNKIVAVDLFLDECEIEVPENVTMRKVNALDLGEEHFEKYDAVIMNMLIHHLVGTDVDAYFRNLEQVIDQAYGALRSKGKLIIVESCVPLWFNIFEKIVYKPASKIIESLISHPPTFQYTSETIKGELIKKFNSVKCRKIVMGKFVLQYGYKFPSALTPVQPHIFTAIK